MRALLSTIWYQLVIFFRLKESLFFIWMFPLLLFAVFGSLWSWGNAGYVPFLLTGVLGLVITNEGFYAVGAVVRDYYTSGLIRYIGKLPAGIVVFFIGYAVSRFVSLIIISLLLCILSFLMFDYWVSLVDFAQIMIGAVVGVVILGSIGLCISFSGVKRSSTNAIMNILGYSMLFTSDAFYPVSEINKKMSVVGDCMPLNGILRLMRTGQTTWWLLLLYFVVSISVFVLLYRRHQYTR